MEKNKPTEEHSVFWITVVCIYVYKCIYMKLFFIFEIRQEVASEKKTSNASSPWLKTNSPQRAILSQPCFTSGKNVPEIPPLPFVKLSQAHIAISWLKGFSSTILVYNTDQRSSTGGRWPLVNLCWKFRGRGKRLVFALFTH